MFYLRNVVQVVFLLILVSCTSQRPTWVYTMEASDSAVHAALDSDPYYPYVWDSDREMTPDFEPPIHLRPCCAFGKDISVQLSKLPVPGYRVANVVSADDLGPHVYDAGFAGKGTDREVKATENNGLVYTCRGGFIDTAHVRDYADWTVYLAHKFWRHLGESLTLNFPPELGPRQIVLQAIDVEGLDESQKTVLAVTMAEWAAYHLSVWHEIAQWYGYGTFPTLFPEYASAFSLEDLYSNMLGSKIAAALIYSIATDSDQVYARNFDIWLENSLKYMGAVRAESTRAYIASVDQLWWDSSKRLPDKYVVRKRVYNVATRQVPLRVPVNRIAAAEQPELMACDALVEPTLLAIKEEVYGYKISEFLTLQIKLDSQYQNTFAFPNERQRKERLVTQMDFQSIAEAARTHDSEEMKTLP